MRRPLSRPPFMCHAYQAPGSHARWRTRHSAAPAARDPGQYSCRPFSTGRRQWCAVFEGAGEVGRVTRGQAQLFTLTYEPGASSIAFNLPAPILRAGTISGPCPLSHSTQSGHHEPACSVAFFIHVSTLDPLGLSPVQYWYFGLFGGLITPAMWPEPASTYFTGPPKNCEPVRTDLAGAIWSSLF